jgi:hypothetical protein
VLLGLRARTGPGGRGMTRPRIRTLKPEMWADESIGGLTRDARLLLIGLITMADDEGRLRAMPAAILGHVFPYDPDATRKLAGWLGEIVGAGLIVSYQQGGLPYIAFRHWRRHQKINRANASTLPAPPDPVIVADNSVNDHDSITESSVIDPGSDTDRPLRAA